MARRPVLTNYPHLHHLLKNDPTANQQFNACLNEVGNSLLTEGQTGKDYDRVNNQLMELTEKHAEAVAFVVEAKKMIRLLGEVMEPQVHLTPYSVDISGNKTYEIVFTAVQVRQALTMHWDLIAAKAEDIIAGRFKEDEEQ